MTWTLTKKTIKERVEIIKEEMMAYSKAMTLADKHLGKIWRNLELIKNYDN